MKNFRKDVLSQSGFNIGWMLGIISIMVGDAVLDDGKAGWTDPSLMWWLPMMLSLYIAGEWLTGFTQRWRMEDRYIDGQSIGFEEGRVEGFSEATNMILESFDKWNGTGKRP